MKKIITMIRNMNINFRKKKISKKKWNVIFFSRIHLIKRNIIQTKIQSPKLKIIIKKKIIKNSIKRNPHEIINTFRKIHLKFIIIKKI